MDKFCGNKIVLEIVQNSNENCEIFLVWLKAELALMFTDLLKPFL